MAVPSSTGRTPIRGPSIAWQAGGFVLAPDWNLTAPSTDPASACLKADSLDGRLVRVRGADPARARVSGVASLLWRAWKRCRGMLPPHMPGAIEGFLRPAESAARGARRISGHHIRPEEREGAGGWLTSPTGPPAAPRGERPARTGRALRP